MRNTEDDLLPFRTVFDWVDWTIAGIPKHFRWKIHPDAKYICY